MHDRAKAWRCLPLLALCLGGPVGLAVAGADLRHDVGWIDAERKKLAPWEPLPVPAVNAADTYEAAVAALPSGEEPGSVSDWSSAVARGDAAEAGRLLPEVRSYVGQCALSFAKMHDAASQDYVSPAEPDPLQLKPWLARYRRLARLECAAAYLARLDGDDRVALTAIEDGYALGVKTPRGGGLIEALVGAACVAIAQRPSTDILLSGTVPADLLRAHAERVRAIRGEMWPLAKTMHFDGVASVRALDQFIAGAISADDLLGAAGNGSPGAMFEAPFTPTRDGAVKTREWIEDRLARYVEELGKPVGVSRFREIADRAEDDAFQRGDRLAEMILPPAGSIADRRAQMVTYLEADETIACLEAYMRENGSYPGALAGLVPGYMPEVPLDPWTGKPLIYRLTPERYTLYAVGPNGVDDGGVTEGHGSMEPDLVIVPVPPPRQG